uniref:Uncharacterized protein n=1 Tax=Romanomermis culicivorax TaxID=13658 RepID=A0A915IWG3_ROMCU
MDGWKFIHSYSSCESSVSLPLDSASEGGYKPVRNVMETFLFRLKAGKRSSKTPNVQPLETPPLTLSWWVSACKNHDLSPSMYIDQA